MTSRSRSRPLTRWSSLVAATAVAVLVAAPAVADDSHTHGEGEHDVALWEGAGSDALDCDELDSGQIRWQLDPGRYHDLTRVELHIDEPVASATIAQGPPFVWVTPYYELDHIEADDAGIAVLLGVRILRRRATS